ncbi:unnamed protein product [Caenorhabditis sp. 36 PRJEB53466]|nr:unnamed protein product [Caenorhabditis sp. 36 PRJEB53466]
MNHPSESRSSFSDSSYQYEYHHTFHNHSIITMIFLFLLALFAPSNAQQLLDLKSFKGGGDTKIDATGPYSIYVSASSDAAETLKQVYVKTSDNQIKSLYDLKNNKYLQDSGFLQPFQVDKEAYVSTVLSDQDLSALKGFLYVTTAQQLANSNGFFVYDVVTAETVNIGGVQTSDNCTVVLLNSNFDTLPWMSTTISSWSQSADAAASVSIYEGIPTDSDEKANSQFFSNPAVLPNGDTVYFTNVEKFSVSLGAFYLKVYKGVEIVIEPAYTEIDGSQTSAFTTTGLYMKPFNQADKKITVLTARDPQYNGTTGANVVGSVPVTATVSLSENDGDQHSGIKLNPADQIRGFSTSAIGQNFTIESNGATAGEFFVQYFVIQDAQVIGQTTAGPFETTTKSTAFTTFFTSLLVPVIGARLL